ncbi:MULTISPECIES: hypothetical protein [unclassified Rhizobium]|uniref:hypothetical protein n=1 Tax=unclassified Rhizobium TaxID=2613769 RepID=UPI0012E3A6F8|nr:MULTISPECIES: hypothetical protein [unclassified Rhizobium]
MKDLVSFPAEKTIPAVEANQQISWDPSPLFAEATAKIGEGLARAKFTTGAFNGKSEDDGGL